MFRALIVTASSSLVTRPLGRNSQPLRAAKDERRISYCDPEVARLRSGTTGQQACLCLHHPQFCSEVVGTRLG